MKKIALGFLLAFALVGCAGPQKSFTVAMRANFDAVCPEYLAYVGRDKDLSPAQKANRIDTVAGWNQLITAAEGPKPEGVPDGE